MNFSYLKISNDIFFSFEMSDLKFTKPLEWNFIYKLFSVQFSWSFQTYWQIVRSTKKIALKHRFFPPLFILVRLQACQHIFWINNCNFSEWIKIGLHEKKIIFSAEITVCNSVWWWKVWKKMWLKANRWMHVLWRIVYKLSNYTKWLQSRVSMTT